MIRRPGRGAPVLAAALALAAAVPMAGCRLHVGYIDLNTPLSPELYRSIELGNHGRRDLLSRLGPPDRVLYTPSEVIFDYVAASHRSTDLNFFVPTDVLPGPNPAAFVLGTLRFFFEPFAEAVEFRGTLPERAARQGPEAAISLIPFARGADLLTLRGRQLRRDRLRVVLDRDALTAQRKSLRLATGEYDEESLPERVLLRAD